MQLFDSVSRWLSDIPVGRRARTGNRVAVDRAVHVRVNDENDVHAAHMRDISFGGAGIRCDLRLTRGDVVWIGIDDGDETFDFSARVVTVRPNELGFFSDYGLRLVEISLPAARSLSAFISRRTPAPIASASRHAAR